MIRSNFASLRCVLLSAWLGLVAAAGCGVDQAGDASLDDGLTGAQVTGTGCEENKRDDGGVRDGGVDAGEGGPYTAGTTCNDRIAPTTANVASILQRSCGLASSCHAGINAQAGLDLSTLDAVFLTAVGHPSSQVPELSVIAPGRPEQSYLLRKVRNLQTVGTAMPPPPSARFCDAKVTAIEAWIREGARR